MATDIAVLERTDTQTPNIQEDTTQQRKQELLAQYRPVLRNLGKGSLLHAYHLVEAAEQGLIVPIAEIIKVFGSLAQPYNEVSGRVFRWTGNWEQAARDMRCFATHLGHSPSEQERQQGVILGFIPTDEQLRRLSGRRDMDRIYRLCNLPAPATGIRKF